MLIKDLKVLEIYKAHYKFNKVLIIIKDKAYSKICKLNIYSI